ncbi:pre-mRNA-splicing factor slu7 [Anaeramoeba flamelloides]|uniref:Pre-mRNA-splicing factor SLU7 n=1 Tax=Anaeramoeba flamelloides TaxID=1746091 RepID=A0AAV7Y9Q7_9EUKA|nr:pre-mRNA-splicing factor slu7 [Anaeramoeba flamelloides]
MSSYVSNKDFKKQKELEEARRSGKADLEVDEEGKEINPHIPQFIAQAPWYLDSKGPSLSHQKFTLKQEKKVAKIGKYYKRGSKAKTKVTKWRKGACNNCGSLTHTAKDCCERPRKRNAKLTKKNFGFDETIEKIDYDYDGKRDRWRGYDPRSHQETIKFYEELEKERKKIRSSELSKELETKKKKEKEEELEKERKKEREKEREKGNENENEKDEDLEQGNVQPYQKLDIKTRITVRNLRIREHTAKYLYNLDPNSAYYDPRTRSMRENPFEGFSQEKSIYQGDNYNRRVGDVNDFNKIQLFAWEIDPTNRGEKISERRLHEGDILEGAPTKTQQLWSEIQQRKKKILDQKRKANLKVYGGEKYLRTQEMDKKFGKVGTGYVEYSSTGRAIQKLKKTSVKSKYDEDTFINGHTSVWGSYWNDGKWGYKCCKSFGKNSKCKKISENK